MPFSYAFSSAIAPRRLRRKGMHAAATVGSLPDFGWRALGARLAFGVVLGLALPSLPVLAQQPAAAQAMDNSNANVDAVLQALLAAGERNATAKQTSVVEKASEGGGAPRLVLAEVGPKGTGDGGLGRTQVGTEASPVALPITVSAQAAQPRAEPWARSSAVGDTNADWRGWAKSLLGPVLVLMFLLVGASIAAAARKDRRSRGRRRRRY